LSTVKGNIARYADLGLFTTFSELDIKCKSSDFMHCDSIEWTEEDLNR